MLLFDYRLRHAIHKALVMNFKLKRWITSDDVKQEVLLRMVRAIRDVEIVDEAHFVHLVLLQLRRSLIDFHRNLYGPNGWATRMKSDPNAAKMNKATAENLTRTLILAGAPISVEEWIDFHESVELLSDDEKAVFEMFFYGGYKEDEIAHLLKCSGRTVRRLWKSSREKLQKRINEHSKKSDNPPLG